MDFLEFADVYQENRGAMNQGRLKLTNSGVVFKNSKTGKVDQVQIGDIETVNWQRIAGLFGLRVMMKNGQLHRYGGFKDSDHDKLQKFFSHTCNKNMHNKDFSIRGWNWGTAKFVGSVLSLDVGSTTAFEIPLLNVSHCTTAKNEVTLEFHQNDDAAVSLMELRFHIPSDAAEQDSVQAFHDNVMSKASVIQATGDAIATFKEVQCLTPRGRYDIKLFPSFIQLHGKTFDYKIPMTTVLRLFLLPHKDQRQMYFVVSLDPPIKQGQTRYHFLILLFNNEDEVTIEMAMTEDDIEEKYAGKLQKEMTGHTFEVISKIMKALVNRKVTVPGNFVGHSSTPAITCSYKAAAGFLYPLERGFIYVHKPPMHIRFEEVASVHFARSGGSTRSFDFEVETKSGVMHTFSSIEKEEYSKLYDFITSKKLRVKNRGQMDQPNYTEDLVDSDVEGEPDAYLARVKAEAQERQVNDGSGDDDDDESDVSFNPEGSGSEVAEEYDSNVATSSSDEEGSGGSGGDKSSSKPEKKSKSKPKEKKTKAQPEKRKRKKKERIEGKPKRPQSAYFLWLNENRERIKTENPGITVTNLTKKAAEQWREIKDKTKWEKLSEEAKRDYEKAMAEFNKTNKGTESESKSGTKSTSKKEAAKKSTPQKSSGAVKLEYKSKEYISSSEGSSDDDAKPEKPSKKPSKKKKDEEDDDKEEDDKEEDEEMDEEDSKVKSEPTSSEAGSPEPSDSD